MKLRATTIFTTGAAALALAACNHEALKADLAPAAPSTAARLAFSDDGANAKLATVATAAPGLILECEHGSGLVHLTGLGGEAGAQTLLISASGARTALPAQVQAFEGRTLVLADAPADAPALRAFRRSALLQVSYGGRTLDAAPQDGRRDAERFLGACARA